MSLGGARTFLKTRHDENLLHRNSSLLVTLPPVNDIRNQVKRGSGLHQKSVGLNVMGNQSWTLSRVGCVRGGHSHRFQSTPGVSEKSQVANNES